MEGNEKDVDLSGLDTVGLDNTKTVTIQNDETKAAEEAKRIADEKAANDLKTAEDEKARIAAEEAANKGATPEAVEIDGVKYKLDDKGNAIDDKNQIVKTKVEIDALVASQEIPLIEEIIKNSGYQPLDEGGKPKVYEDSTEGLLQANKDIADLIAKKRFDEIINSDPDVKALKEFKDRGGKVEDFIKRKSESWKNVKLDVNNVEQLRKVVMADLIKSGMPQDQAELTTKMYEDTKKLGEFGNLAHGRLIAHEDALEKFEKEKDEFDKKQYEQDTEKHWQNVNGIIKKGVLNNITIPESDRDSFYNYIAQAVDEKGNSQASLERSKLPLEQLLQLEFLQYKKFDLSKLIASAVKQQNVISLRTRLKSEKGLGGGLGINENNHQKPDNSKISLDNMM